MFAGRAERNRGCDSVSVIILRCPMWGVSQLFLEIPPVVDGVSGACGACGHGMSKIPGFAGPCPYRGNCNCCKERCRVTRQALAVLLRSGFVDRQELLCFSKAKKQKRKKPIPVAAQGFGISLPGFCPRG